MEIIKKILQALAKILSGKPEVKKEEEKKQEGLVEIDRIPVFREKGAHVLRMQQALINNGHDIKADSDFGPKTKAALVAFQKSKGSRGTGVIGPKTLDWLGLTIKEKELLPPKKNGKMVPWLVKALTWKGKHETRDKTWAKWMASQWKHLGLDLPHISQSWSAWCGLAVAVSLMGVGLDYQKNGAAAKNWLKFGHVIDWKTNGIPQGAIVQINHNGKSGCGKSKGNHVAFANGDCTAKYLLTSKATIDLYGGNQGNSWKVSTYPVWKICGVRWPKDAKDYPVPGRVIEMKQCSSGAAKWESTR